jgi:hypothetical protein
MNIREFAKPVTAKSLNESLAARFGQKINLERFTIEQLQDARNRLRTKLSQVETNESFDAVHNETYQKSKMMLDVLNAALSERGHVEEDTSTKRLREGEEDKAELVMSAKDMVDRLTGWMEDVAEMQTESMLELADAIRDELGQESSEAFVGLVKPALDSLYQAMESTRTSLTGGVSQLTGEGTAPTPMPGEEPGMDADLGAEDELDADLGGDITPVSSVDDDFGAAEPAAGGEEPADRAKRESKDYSAKKAAAGKDIGKPGKQFAKIAKSAGEKYGSKERGEKVAGAVLKKLRTKESVNPTTLANILSKKK